MPPAKCGENESKDENKNNSNDQKLPILTEMTKEEIDSRHPIDLSTEVVARYANGGTLTAYNSIDRDTGDFHRIRCCAEFFARQGKTVVMTPKLDVPYKNPAYDLIYGTLRGTPYYGKCPDLLVDGVWYEHEGFCGNNPKRSFRNMCNHGFRQSDRIIIEDCGLTDGYMLRSIGGQLKAGVEITEVWIHRGDDYQILFKTEG